MSLPTPLAPTMKKSFKTLFKIFLLVSVLVSFSGCSNSNDYEIFGAIHGLITDSSTGEPLDKASVLLSPSGITKQTDASGYYSFDNLEIQQYTITVQREGYQPNRKTITTVSGENFQVDIQLTRIPQ